MKIKRILNNNAIVVKDRDGEKVIMGLGIGFQKNKNDPVDISRIEKIFVVKAQSEHQQYEETLSTLPQEHIQALEKIDINRIINDIVDMIGESLKTRLSEDINWLSKLAKACPSDCGNRTFCKRLYEKVDDL